ncbi:MAG TPA: hypothetical protein VF659_17730 [Pyrinomonadaceae bacterium]|jgi:hypothetical protein
MADLEVEKTLREIRERVLAEAQSRAPEAAAPAAPAAHPSAAPGAGGPAGEALARMDANLATTARAWSRLPPMLSYRRGAPARLELWLKGLVKRAAHWFTWEQVNFNSAAHHALLDARAALGAHEQALARLQSEIVTALRAELEADRARVAGLEARLAQAEGHLDLSGARLQKALAAGLERMAEAQRGETAARAEELHAEVRARLDGLLEEQRVCFKQLSLEAGEAAVTLERTRRRLEARLGALEGEE